jgi:Flp pilus assembly secretin CpaC
MRWSIVVAFAAALLFSSHSSAGGDKASSGKKFLFSLRVLEGDPLGSVEAGTLKILAEPNIVTLDGRSFSFRSGGELTVPDGPKAIEFVEFGRKIEGKPSAAKDGKIRLDITLSNTTIGKKSKDRIELNTESTRTITTVKRGEIVKLRWGKGKADKQTWAELSVQEIKP